MRRRVHNPKTTTQKPFNTKTIYHE